MGEAIKRLLRKHPETSALVVCAVISVVFVGVTGGMWGSVGNMQSVLQITAILAIMAMGVALVITTGEIDISVGSTFGIGALCFLGLGNEYGAFVAFFVALAAGALIGLFNGFVVTRFAVPSLIATLGTLFIFRGIAYALTEGFTFQATAALKGSWIYQLFGGGAVLGLNAAIWWAVVLLFVGHVALFYTRFGNHLLATGGSSESARSRGVRVRAVKLTVFVLSGALAAFAGVLEANKIGVADGSFGRLMELEAIAAAVIGGCALAGGRSSLIGAVAGAFALSGIQSFLVIQGVQPQWFILLLGALIVAATYSERRLYRAVVG